MLEKREKMLENILIVMGNIILGFIVFKILVCLAIIIVAKIRDIREDRQLMKKIRDRS